MTPTPGEALAIVLATAALAWRSSPGTPGGPGTPGSSGVVAPLSNAAPQNVGVVSPGSSGDASRADHVHAHGVQAAGIALHDIASAIQDGFASPAMAQYLLYNINGPQTLTGPGLADITTPYTRLITNGVGNAVGLNNGSFQGQRKDFLAISGYAGAQTSVITPSVFTGPLSSILFNALGQRATLAWNAGLAAWDLISWSGAVTFI